MTKQPKPKEELKECKIPKKERDQIIDKMRKIIEKNNSMLKKLGIMEECYS